MNEHEPIAADMPPSTVESVTGPAVAAGAGDTDPDGRPAIARRRRGVETVVAAVFTGHRPHVLAGIAVAVAVIITAGTLAWNQPASPAIAPGASSDTAASPGSPAPTLAPASTEPLTPDAATPLATLVADHAVGSVVQLDSRFRLTSVDGTPASALASRLTVTPSTELTATTDPGDQAVTLTPTAPLTPGVIYRFALGGPTGELVDSWAFQARQPLHIVSTLPDNQQSDVPLDTGIEVTFDQDGLGEVASHVTIEPATRGHFETHDRTVAFVPDQPLAPATLYTVTVTKGVAVADTGEQTDADTRFAFETTATGTQAAQSGLAFPSDEVESRTADRPVISVWQFEDPGHKPKKAPLTVYRFAGMAAAVDAWRSLRARPDWTRYSTRGLVDTSALRRVVAADVDVHGVGGTWWVSLPERLPAGWYLVQLSETRPLQTILQVTDVAGYVAVSETRTIVWANDLVNGHPIAGATAVVDGASLGRTAKDGLLFTSTPRSLLTEAGARCDRPCEPVVIVTAAGGRSVFLPTTSSHDKLEGIDSGYMWSEADPSFWTLFDTDRARYRSTDTVNVWGILRSRADGSVPSTVTIRLRGAEFESTSDLPIASVAATPSRTGVFIASIPLVDIPDGNYRVDLVAGVRTIQSVDVTVGAIAKPAYELEVATGRRVYITGDAIKVTVRASFFEGTPVPGVRLHIQGLVGQRATTAADGTAVARLTATPEQGTEGATSRQVDVTPARTEEGEIVGATAEYVVYPATQLVDARASIAGGSVLVKGSVHALARDRLENAISAGARYWDVDPNGPPIGGAAVRVHFDEIVPTRVNEGSTYDFITKKVVPNYRIETELHDRGTLRLRTTTNGTFRVAFPRAVRGHDYQVVLSVADADGHVWRSTVVATSETGPQASTQHPELELTKAPAPDWSGFRIGDDVNVTMTGGGTSGSASRSRYVFFVAHQGIRSVVVQTSPRFVTPFAAWAVPNLEIGAIRFDGRAYVGDVSFAAQFRTNDRRLDVRLTSDAPRYRPGETATVRVRTLDAAGSPVAATVVLRAVDEKLFSIGAATPDDPLAELYGAVESGITGTYASHQSPRGEGEGGDTTGGGGGDRSNFRDTLLFRTVTTNADGRASAAFKVSDDLTAWRVTASAISGHLQAGTSSVLLPVGLPFFVDASIAPEYLVGDRPSISVRTYGSAIVRGTPVRVTLSSSTLGTNGAPIATTAFASVDIPLPPLRLGLQTVTLTATTGTGPNVRTDRLTRTFRVVETRLTRSVRSLMTLGDDAPSSLTGDSISGGLGLTSVVVSDAGSGAYLPVLEQLSSDPGARFEQALAAELADGLLVERFGFTPEDLEPSGYEADRYQSAETDGIAILPYAGTDLEASVFAALVGQTQVDRQRLTAYLREVHVDRQATRERQLMAAAGLAALGDPNLPELQRAATDPTLTIRERLFVGIGLAAAGDTATAKSLESSLVTSAGERLAAVARLRVGDDVGDTRQATALMAALAAMVGDSHAPLFWAYVASTPAADRLESLPAIAYVTASLQRLAPEPASFALTVDGKRSTITPEPGRGYRLALTQAQIATLRIDRLTGTIAVVAGWREAAAPADFAADPDVTIARTIQPTTVDGASLVEVNLSVSFRPTAAPGCHDVTDLLPSGLTPVGTTLAWPDTGEEARPAAYTAPYEESADRVRFCADPTSPTGASLRYFARAVTSGSYIWEPAVIESTTQAGHASLTPEESLTIH